MIRVLALILLAGPATAQDSFNLPAGCIGYVTVQKRGCIVSHLFTCHSDPAGYQRRVDLEDGLLSFFGVTDAETQWVEGTRIAEGITDTIEPDPADPKSLSELLDTGSDTSDFIIQTDSGVRTRNVGQVEIIDPNVTIDGVTLQLAAFTLQSTNISTGIVAWTIEGHDYVHPKWRAVFAGIGAVRTPTESYTTDHSPVEFAFPGEDGFLTVSPRYDCSVPVSALTPDVTLVSATGD